MNHTGSYGMSMRYTTKVDPETGNPMGQPQFVTWNLVSQQNLLDKHCRLGNIASNLLEDIWIFDFPTDKSHKSVNIEQLPGYDNQSREENLEDLFLLVQAGLQSGHTRLSLRMTDQFWLEFDKWKRQKCLKD